MKTSLRFLTTVFLGATLATFVRAADVDGKWKAEFGTQIGVQKYVFDLKADGEKLTGKAASERQDGSKSDTTLTEGKITKDEVFFVEPLKLQDFDLRIEYKGKVSGDEMKLTRKVGDFGTEELVAKRIKPEPKK